MAVIGGRKLRLIGPNITIVKTDGRRGQDEPTFVAVVEGQEQVGRDIINWTITFPMLDDGKLVCVEQRLEEVRTKPEGTVVDTRPDPTPKPKPTRG